MRPVASFLVDESAGRAVADFLRADGHDVLSAADSLRGVDDETVLARAEAEGRILVTNDKGFGQLVYGLERPAAGVVLLRLADERPKNKVRVLREVLKERKDALAGFFIVAREAMIKARPLDTS